MALKLALTFSLALSAGSLSAQSPEPHHHDPAERIGTVEFPISCNAEARTRFNRAVAWLHSFEYEEAERAFAAAGAADPSCAMSHWGVAMSVFHPLWAPPSPAELEKGRSAIERAAAANAGTERERDYIAALRTFYANADRADHRARALAYSDAMGRLHARYPTDDEAAVFYALTLIAAGTTDSDPEFARERRAAQILDGVLARRPGHPGVAHYLIHGYDYPPLAHLALTAARSYAAIAPASAHAQHMPSHIFTRLGLWEEAAQSNIAAETAARAYAARQRMPGAWDEQLHAMDYLAYAYLQLGQEGRARAVLDELARITQVQPPNFKVAYAFTAIPARFTLERRQWREAAALPLPSPSMGGVPYERFPWARANIHFARAVGAARSGDAASARREVASLEAARQSQAAVPGEYDWATQVEIQRRIAAAWLARAEGRTEEALELMTAAADLDDATEKHPVTPGAIVPAREQLGELLLELARPAEALATFEASLRRAPNRLAALYGAARAARLADNRAQASRYYANLLELCRNADRPRPELEEARAFLAQPAG